MFLAILNHLVESIALLGVYTRDTVIRIDASNLPFRGGIDFLGVVQFLDFKAALLFFFLGADAAVGRHPQLAHRVFPSGALSQICRYLDDFHVAHGFPLTQFVRSAV